MYTYKNDSFTPHFWQLCSPSKRIPIATFTFSIVVQTMVPIFPTNQKLPNEKTNGLLPVQKESKALPFTKHEATST
jgi:hypothetical protein